MALQSLTAATVLACGALLGPATAPAVAADYPSTLTLTLSKESQPVQSPRSTALTCNPPSGTHPNAAAACRDLQRASGRFTQLPGDPAYSMCTMRYDPITASATGTWRGWPVAFTRTYPNACVLNSETGSVFRF